MKSRKLLAAGTVGALVLGSLGLGALVNSAQAGTANQTYTGTVVVFGGAPNAQTVALSTTVTSTPAAPNQGDAGTITWETVGPNSFAPLSAGGVISYTSSIKPIVNGVTGAAIAGTPVLASNGYTAPAIVNSPAGTSPAIAGGNPTPLPEYTAAYTFAAKGQTDFFVSNFFFCGNGACGVAGVEATYASTGNAIGANPLALTVPGPDFTVTAIANQSVTNAGRVGEQVTVAGTLFGADAAAGAVTVTVDGIAAANNNVSVTSNALSGTFDIPAGAVAGANIVITNGAATDTEAITVLGAADLVVSPASAAVGAQVTLTGTTGTWNPTQTVAFTTAIGTPASIAASAAGGFTQTFNVASGNGASPITASQVAGPTDTDSVTITTDACTAYFGTTPNPAGPCIIDSTVNVQINPGNLSQRHYNKTQVAVRDAYTTTALSPTANGPVVPNTNSGNQTVNLGEIVSPVAPVNIFGTLNDITVTDARGGTVGWSLTATMTDFASSTPSGNSIKAEALALSPVCKTATAANAWDIDAAGKAVIPGYVDPWTSQFLATTTLTKKTAALSSAGANTSVKNLSTSPVGTLNLCTLANTTLNNFGTTSGVFNVETPARLTVPAFQAVGKYTATMSVKLA